MINVAIEYAMPTRRMRILADELNELISRIEMSQLSSDDIDTDCPPLGVDDWLEVAEDEYNLRRYREKVFGDPQLFGEPTWDILLDLFIAELKKSPMQTTSVCIGAQVPQTTALRWIALLERQNLVSRYKDKADSRRVYIQLTETALKKMVQVFYDRCFAMMSRKKYQAPKLNRLVPGTVEFDEAKETLLSDTIAQIKISKYREIAGRNDR